jgi:hypothetical protein
MRSRRRRRAINPNDRERFWLLARAKKHEAANEWKAVGR